MMSDEVQQAEPTVKGEIMIFCYKNTVYLEVTSVETRQARKVMKFVVLQW